MTDYLPRHEYDPLRATLQGDPEDVGFTALRGVPQIIHRSWANQAWSGLDNDWQRIFTFNGRGGLLYPDRMFELTMFGSISNPNYDGNPPARPWSVRYTIGGVVVRQQDILDTITLLNTEFHFRILALGSNSAQYVPNADSPEVQLDLANGWELGIDFKWYENDISTVVSRSMALGLLW